MKLVSLIAVVAFALNSAYAEEQEQRTNINLQNLSKRPYVQVPANKAESFEGNLSNTDSVEQDKKYKTLNLHNLGRRPYAEKNTD